MLIFLAFVASALSFSSGSVFFGIAFLVAFFVLIGGAKGQLASYSSLAKKGLAARGIVLNVTPVALSTSPANGLLGRVEVRVLTLDVEVPGQEPYVMNGGVWIPTNLTRDVLPGATLELRVDPKDPNKVAIIGPGAGFAGAPLLGAPAGRPS